MDADSLDIIHILATELAPFIALWVAADRLFFSKMRAATAEIQARIKDLEKKSSDRNVSDALIAQRVEHLEKLQK